MVFKILDIIQTPNAILHEFGLKVYDIAKNSLDKGDEVVLSFEGLRNVNSLFCNASIGKLYLDFPEKAKSNLKFEDISNKFWEESIFESIELATEPIRVEARSEAISKLFHH